MSADPLGLAGIGIVAVDEGEDAQASFDEMLRRCGDRNAAAELFNTRYAVVNEAGKAMIDEQIVDPVRRRKVLVRFSFEDLKKLYANRLITSEIEVLVRGKRQKKDIIKSATDWWLAHPDRRSYIGGVIFDPTASAPGSYWNLWSGFAVAPAPGSWALMQDHIYRVVCGGNRRDFEYLLGLAARMYQEPQLQGEVVVVLRGPEGAGKGLFLRYLIKGFGQHGLQITNAQHLVGAFNGHLRDLVALFADEAFYAGHDAHLRVLKSLITEPTLVIEDKYRTVVEAPNMLHIWMAADRDWVVPVSLRDRRFFVRDVSDNRVGRRAYFRAIVDEMENGGLAAMLWDLLRRDLAGFDFRDIPQTDARRDQQALSLPELERWWLDVLARGFVWKSRHGAPWFTEWAEDGFYTTELLARSHLQWCDENRPRDRANRVELGKFLTRLYRAHRPGAGAEYPIYEIVSIDRRETEGIANSNGGGWLKEPKTLDEVAIVHQARQHGYLVGSLDDARARFAEMVPIDVPWSEP
jgi:hypothetical protein